MTFARRQYSRTTVPLTPATRTGVVRRVSDEVRAVPKDLAAKPGKRAPTVVEQKWMDAIVRFGCVACFVSPGVIATPAEVHHLISGNKRMGHLFTIPLCTYHHRGQSPNARHPWKKRFEAAYGTELELLAMLKQRLGFFDGYEVKA